MCFGFQNIAFWGGKKREYGVETGKPLDAVVLGEVLGAALDEDTVGRLEDGGISIKDYEKVKIWAENRHMRLQSRAAGKDLPKDSDKTVYGVDAAPPPMAAPPSACALLFSTLPSDHETSTFCKRKQNNWKHKQIDT